MIISPDIIINNNIGKVSQDDAPILLLLFW